MLVAKVYPGIGWTAKFCRARGFDVAEHIPDSAVVDEGPPGHYFWSYVSMTFEIKVTF